MPRDGVQIFRLIRTAPADGAAFHLHRDFLRALGGLGFERIDAGFGQTQRNLRAGQRFVLRGVVQIADHAIGELHRIPIAADAIHIAAVGDFHAEAQFDLAQMFVERTVEIGEPFDVVRFEDEIVLGQCGHPEEVACVRRRIKPPAERGRVRAANWPSPA